jgi:hypothetical protein
MSAGFVYVLENETIPGLLKIGSTEKDPDERAKELTTTGVPVSFKVVYRRYVADNKLVEELVHKALESQGGRRNNNREFFEVSIAEAIRVIESISPEQDGSTLDRVHGYWVGESIYLHTELPGYAEPIDEKEVERLKVKLTEIARIGYHPALHTLAEIFMRIFLNSIQFRMYYQEYLIACQKYLNVLIDPRNSDKYEIGKSVAKDIECLIEMKRVMASDFDFVQKFLLSGDQFIYEGFIDHVNRFSQGEIKDRCLNL